MRARRRRFLWCLGALPLVSCRTHAADIAVQYARVTPGRTLQFPADFGSHPDYRTEWWYITGWLEDEHGAPLGVQITFFRHRPGIAEGNASRFAPRQLLFAHAAIADPRTGHLRHEQRAARAGFSLAEASQGNTDVRLEDWSLVRNGDIYTARIRGSAFTLDLAFRATQAPLLEGEVGYSRKGPRPEQASYYYSEPHLAASGDIALDGGRRFATRGSAWCDHEWSNEYLAPEAAGWDWTGINLDDGGALMAFVIRRRGGGVLWAGGSLRPAGAAVRAFAPAEIRFEARRTWRSPRTQAVYPIAPTVHAGELAYELEPLFDDQELDARVSTGIVYWEGAVRALRAGREVGRGYLELTGYASEVRL